jgi:hypothetical protein
MKNGITKGYLTHKISNDSSKGYIELKNKLIDEKVNIPLRYEKIKSILSGKNQQGEDLWNNGNPLRIHIKEYKIFIQKNKPEIWDEFSKINLEHKYREKMNRQGHSNSKKSYWAIGFDTLQEFYEKTNKDDVTQYKKIHNNCCGLGDPKTSIKNLKKIQRKKRRKEFHKKKKNDIIDDKGNNKMEIEKEDEKDKNNSGIIRGRGRRFFGGRGRRRKAPRGRGGFNANVVNNNVNNANNNKIDVDEDDDEDMEEDEAEKNVMNKEEKKAISKEKNMTKKKRKRK